MMQTFDNQDVSEMLDLFNKNQSTEFTVIITGPTGSGKSTLSNGFIKEKMLFENNGTFIPTQQNAFKISTDLTQSMTKDPQFHKIDQEFSLWDIPGFGDSRSVDIDIKTNFFANLIFNSGKKILILLLIQLKEIIQGKCTQIVEILNMMKDANVSILLIITKTEKRNKIQDVISILKKLINNQETKMENQAKFLLQEIIDKQQVLLIKNPSSTKDNPKIFELDQQDFIQIFAKVYDKDIYKQSNFSIQLSKEAIEKLEQQMLNFKQQYQQQLKLLLKSQSLLKIYQTSFDKNKQNLFQKQTDDLLSQQKVIGKIIENYNKVAKQIQIPELTPNEYQEYCNVIEKLFMNGITEELQGQELFIKGLQISSSQVMSIYNIYQVEKIILITIYIYSQQGFCVDQDIILPGINLLIQTQEFFVKQQSQINLKGNKGKSHHKAQIENNNIPQSLKGNPGQNGGSLYIGAKIAINLDLLEINLSGGDGGDGQEGADGVNGKDGKDGDYEMVKNKDEKCNFHFEEEPFDLAQVFLTFNRTFKCFYKSPGQSGSKGGNSRQGGLGGCIGQKGLSNFNISQNSILNVIDTQSEEGKQGQAGQPGKGGKKGRDYEGVEQQIKVFGRTRDLKNLEKKQDNLGVGLAGNVATEVGGTALGVGIVQGAKLLAEEIAALSLPQVLKGAALGVTSVVSFAATIGLQIAASGIQILHSDHKWLKEPHPVDNEECANTGEVMDNDQKIEQNDIDAQIQKQRQEFQERIEQFICFQKNFNEKIRSDYPIQEVHETLFEENFQETAK